MADGGGKKAVADRLSGLPDHLLQHVLSFLPSIRAVRTCVLSRRYPEQWKSVPAIRITRADAMRYLGPSALNRIVNCLLLFRNKLPLDEIKTPFLESMPFLMDAFVRLQQSDDCCQNCYEAGDCGDQSCKGCRGINYGKNTCVLLEALSSATKLELLASPEVFIFRRDLAQCPMFFKLKTLLLNEWCLTANHGAFLSPALTSFGEAYSSIHYNLVEMGASYNLKKQSLILKNFTLEIKCDQVDDRIRRVLEIFCSYGLPMEKIKIKPLPMSFDTQFHDTWSSGSRFQFRAEYIVTLLEAWSHYFEQLDIVMSMMAVLYLDNWECIDQECQF
ncbi:hypothetical protein PR202_gb19744 [Eleusine coracana subsp. coracana]|uniref:F-box domain-containing protein n=1 Tax=Eleusine coracana subsp. coracana TaxID=191504 RepID=A0AAV5F8V0_ELECO|nr:hypothetical protein PR202_gb19744 [Eleusine coracana subsp. coracana]